MMPDTKNIVQITFARSGTAAGATMRAAAAAAAATGMTAAVRVLSGAQHAGAAAVARLGGHCIWFCCRSMSPFLFPSLSLLTHTGLHTGAPVGHLDCHNTPVHPPTPLPIHPLTPVGEPPIAGTQMKGISTVEPSMVRYVCGSQQQPAAAGAGSGAVRGLGGWVVGAGKEHSV